MNGHVGSAGVDGGLRNTRRRSARAAKLCIQYVGAVTFLGSASPSPAQNANSPITVTDMQYAKRVAAPAEVNIWVGLRSGSGVFIRTAQGLRILTVAHVIGSQDQNQPISIRLYTSDDWVPFRRVLAQLVVLPDGSKAYDPNIDLALLELVNPADLPSGVAPLSLRDTTAAPLELGDPVIVVGNPYGYNSTVRDGAISWTSRRWGSISYVQIDMPVEPGNSGGPCFTIRRGPRGEILTELIGVVVAAILPFSTQEAILIVPSALRSQLAKWGVKLM